MMKRTVALVSAIFLLVICLCVESFQLSNVIRERNVSLRNTEALICEIDTFRTSNGLLSAKVKELQLSKRDFERLFAEDANEIAYLKKRNEELERIVKTQSETKVEFITEIRDSIVYVKGQLDTLKSLHWEDKPWLSFDGEIAGNNLLKASIMHHDELDVAVFLEWKKFLWFKIRLEGCDVNVVSHNPYTESLSVSSVSIINKCK